jgi:hypothetical protein
MEKLSIDLKHCYGIKDLQYTFDFTSKSTYSIYAPNGTMKTSFASTFKDLSESKNSGDSVFPQRNCTRLITDEGGTSIDSKEVFVVVPYDQGFKSDRISTLLVHSELKERYDQIHEEINNKKTLLIQHLQEYSGLKAEVVEKAFSRQFTASEDDFLTAITRIKGEAVRLQEPIFSDVSYTKVFNDKTSGFLESEDFRHKLEDYVTKYNELIDESTFFQKGVFTHHNAASIAKSLRDNGFFEAKHSLNLNSIASTKRIETMDELIAVIEEEKNSIINNPELKKAFDRVDLALEKNVDLRNFRNYMINQPKILPELANTNQLKEKLWISYLAENKELVTQLEQEYSNGKEEIERIVQQAEREATEWRNVINEFNKRFSVPFILKVKNQHDVILKHKAPSIKFEFRDQGETCEIEETKLYSVLSNGELKALYILNILFEVQARLKQNQPTLFVIDDIADSFDYKNKYAIIEYLQDVSKIPLFKQIILTHNYDFFRTVSSRLDMDREQKLNSIRTDEKILLEQDVYQNNPFNFWKKNLHVNNDMLVASIPFVRNIVEYTGDDQTFLKLTSLLHIKPDSNDIKVRDIEIIFRSVLQDIQNHPFQNPDKKVIDLIFEESDRISQNTDEVLRLEDKIVIAIGIRLKAELFMIAQINDQTFVDSISKNQTRKLFDKFIGLFPNEDAKIATLDKVNLMTPENIHLNSFMYEPILDMANHHLKNLYMEVSAIVPN